MDYDYIFFKLEQNIGVFKSLLSEIPSEQYLWKKNEEKWCLLEIVCHLYDEEREDFRTRLKYVLEDPAKDPPRFNPINWVTERKYLEQDYNKMLEKFLKERTKSLKWLYSLKNPQWDNTYKHASLGPMSGHLYISNWLAHDYMHIRQIIQLKFDYLKKVSGESLIYAGNW